MIEWIRALFAARRLELRDRGKIKAEWITHEDGYIGRRTWAHVSCNTRMRIGIKNERTVRWCWRCEQILGIVDRVSPPPGAEDDGEEGHDTKVIPLFGGQKK